ncbi:hypothetical protein [Massilia pseudoviolaceinigra]|uniref:hypothetical protein n=1 Tax=Massilia pseudoviolaceinigra TaxID=3057165 RepID=UPI002796886E|nr:hypothetical protein [Massilia sp. CCM 9206]MDQ1920068.1 hypothetical protein [Massilia sp. CCM 9206]
MFEIAAYRGMNDFLPRAIPMHRFADCIFAITMPAGHDPKRIELTQALTLDAARPGMGRMKR